MSLLDYSPWRMNARLVNCELRIDRLERRMAKDKEALARLDEQIAALKDYVRSDEETDAAEVDKRTEEIRTLLAEAQGSGEATPEDVAQAESDLTAINDEASEQA